VLVGFLYPQTWRPERVTQTQKPFPADYQQLSAILALVGSEMSAAELHGIICGGICVLPVTRSAAGTVDLLQLKDPQPPLLDAVTDLTAHSGGLLKDADPEFGLLLPPDSTSLTERTEALADWCRGFVLALLQGPYTDPKQLPVELQEVVQDMLAIAQAESSGDDPTGEEWAMAELEEYVRTGVQLIYEELYASHPGVDPQANEQ